MESKPIIYVIIWGVKIQMHLMISVSVNREWVVILSGHRVILG